MDRRIQSFIVKDSSLFYRTKHTWIFNQTIIIAIHKKTLDTESFKNVLLYCISCIDSRFCYLSICRIDSTCTLLFTTHLPIIHESYWLQHNNTLLLTVLNQLHVSYWLLHYCKNEVLTKFPFLGRNFNSNFKICFQ